MERVDLVQVWGKTRHRRWRHGWTDGPFVTYVGVGQLDDGRWFAERYGRAASRWDTRQGACVYAAGERGRRLAEDTARRWRRSTPGEWREVVDEHQLKV